MPIKVNGTTYWYPREIIAYILSIALVAVIVFALVMLSGCKKAVPYTKNGVPDGVTLRCASTHADDYGVYNETCIGAGVAYSCVYTSDDNHRECAPQGPRPAAEAP